VDYWRSSTAAFKDGLPRYDVTLRIDPGAARWLSMWRPATMGGDAIRSEGAESEWLTMRVGFDCEAEACAIVLGLGPRADVLAPEALRVRVLAEASALLARAARQADSAAAVVANVTVRPRPTTPHRRPSARTRTASAAPASAR
jgi:WYL domain